MADRSEFVQLLIPIIQSSRFGGLHVVIAAAEVIAEDARENLWFATIGKNTLDEEQAINHLNVNERLIEKCKYCIAEAEKTQNWKKFVTDLQSISEELRNLRKA
jgi:hypothetical protein